MSSIFNTPIICLEGLDCSGKESISKLLKRKLDGIGKKALIVSFPDYELDDTVSVILNPIMKPYIFGNDMVHIQINAFTNNIYTSLVKLEKEIADKNISYLIFDRYWHCNAWYQMANFLKEIKKYYPERNTNSNYKENITILAQIIRQLRFNQECYNFPIPQHYFYIKMPIEKIKEFLMSKANKDANELDLNFLEIAKTYADFSNDNILFKQTITGTDKTEDADKICHTIDTMKNERELKTLREITQEIYDIIKGE